MPMPSWQYTIRSLLSKLHKTVLTDSQLSDLHITLEDEEDEHSTRLSDETTSVIDALFTTSDYLWQIRCLPRDFPTRPAKSTSQWIASLLRRWMEDLGNEHSENRVAFQCSVEALRITGDTRTEGVKTEITARDMENGHSIAVIIRNRRRHEWQLSSAELYALLALADEQRLARPSASLYKVQIMVVNRYWIQRLSMQIPSSFLASIINGESDLAGNIHIRRTPWFNFTEEQGRRSALRAVFEHFSLKTISTRPCLSHIYAERLLATRHKEKDTDKGFALKKRRTRRDQSYIFATSSARSKDVQVTSLERSA